MATSLDKISAGIGRSASWTVTLNDANGDPIFFLGTEPIACSCWLGSDQSVLFSPVVTWVPPVDDHTNRILLTVASTDTSTLPPGQYMLSIDRTDIEQDLFDGVLDLTSTPGTAQPPKVYCEYSDDPEMIDMLNTFPEIGDFESYHSATQFLFQRAMARRWLDQILQRHYRWTGYRGLTTFGYPVSIYPAWSSDGHSPLLQTWLDDDKLIRTPLLKEICVNRALGLALTNTYGTSDKESQYMSTGNYYLMRADDLVKCYVGEIDLSTPPSGYAAVTIPCSVASMRF